MVQEQAYAFALFGPCMGVPDSVFLTGQAIVFAFALVIGLMVVFAGLDPKVAWYSIKRPMGLCPVTAALSFAAALFSRAPKTTTRLFHAGILATVTALEALLFCLLLRRKRDAPKAKDDAIDV